ncbi:MAG TPA: site-specific integrase [Acetobacteraceae bacterium]|nr:site-specific integrase [Acetobacteraceae bacterium]
MADKPNFKAIDRLVRALPRPATGNKRYSVTDLRQRGLTGPWVDGLQVRVTAADARAWVIRYRAEGIERLHSLGSVEAWPAEKVWPAAAELRRLIDEGGDPRAERKAKQEAPTIADLADRFTTEHLPRLRPATSRDYTSLLRMYVRPQLGQIKVAALRHSDAQRLHDKVAETAPYRANRCMAVLAKMMGLAVNWEMRQDNPVRGIERAPEQKRERFLTPAEIARLADVLATHPERTSANAARLLLLTGARKGETLAAKWADIDIGTGTWSKPASTTKTAKLHRVPLNAPAMQLLSGMKAEADQENARRDRDGLPRIEYVFPSVNGKSLGDIKHFWVAVCKKAGLSGVRVHDLRHTYASILASSGLSLPVIGALLGHSQAQTTNRYAHLMDDPLRAAAERAGAVISGAGKPAAEVVQITEGRRA